MKGEFNPKLEVGDRIILYHMEGETSVPPGTKGTVSQVSRDPFELMDEKLIRVNWDNGSTLALVTSTDMWKKVPQEQIEEQRGDSTWNFITQNPDVFENFDWRWFEKFLYKLRDSGIINMFGAAPLLYAGREHIDRYYGEGREDEEKFQEVLEDADESRDKIVQGVIKYMEKNNKNLDDMGIVNRYAHNFSQKIVGVYFALSGFRG